MKELETAYNVTTSSNVARVKVVRGVVNLIPKSFLSGPVNVVE